MRKTLACLALLLSLAAHAQTSSTSGGTIVLGGATPNAAILNAQNTATNAATAAGNAQTTASNAASQAVQAQHEAGALSPLDYGITCGGTLASTTSGQLMTYLATGTAADTALTSTLAAAGNASGSAQTGPTIGIQLGNFGNLPQGVLTLPPNQICTAVGPVVIAPGVGFNTNHSVLFITGTGHGLWIKNNGPNGNYGANKNRIYGGGVIVGPGVGTSQGDGLLADVGINLDVSDVNFYQFKHGWEAANVQYSTFTNVWAAHNEVGCVVNSTTVSNGAVPVQGVTTSSLLSIDDAMFGGGCVANTKAGLWEPAGALFRLYGVSRSWNDHIDMVTGPMPAPYLSVKGYAVTTAATSCTATGTTAIGNNGTSTPIAPMTISAPSGGTVATGFVTLSAANNGTITGAYGINPGAGYTAQPTIIVPACTGGTNTITATIINDQTTDPQGQYASFVGTTVDDAGDFEADGYRTDGVGQRPAYGSAVLLNTGTGSYDLRRPFFGLTPEGDDFTRMVTNYGTKNEVEWPQGSSGMSPIPNALGAADNCAIVSTQQAGVVSKWGVDDTSASHSCDGNYTPILGSNGAYQGFYQGSTAANGFTSYSGSAAYGFGFGTKLPGDVSYRSSFYTNGRYRVGDGTAGNSGIGYLGYAGFSLGTGGANSTASPAVVSTGGTFALDSDTYFSNLPMQWQSQSGGNYSIPLTGDVNNFLTVYNRTTGGGAWYAASSGVMFNGSNNTFGFAFNACSQSSTKGVCTTPVNIFTATSAGTDVAGVEAVARGASIASAATIAPITGFVHITGTTAISTITPPTNCTVTGYACTVKFLPDAAWTTVTGGNIAVASTAVVNKPLTMTYDNTAALWYPSY